MKSILQRNIIDLGGEGDDQMWREKTSAERLSEALREYKEKKIVGGTCYNIGGDCEPGELCRCDLAE